MRHRFKQPQLVGSDQFLFSFKSKMIILSVLNRRLSSVSGLFTDEVEVGSDCFLHHRLILKCPDKNEEEIPGSLGCIYLSSPPSEAAVLL